MYLLHLLRFVVDRLKLLRALAQLGSHLKLRHLLIEVATSHRALATHLVTVERDRVNFVAVRVRRAHCKVATDESAAKHVVDSWHESLVAADFLPQVDGVVAVGQIVRLLPEAVERQERQPRVDLLAVDVRDTLGRRLVRVDNHAEQLVAGSHFHRRTIPVREQANRKELV